MGLLMLVPERVLIQIRREEMGFPLAPFDDMNERVEAHAVQISAISANRLLS